MKLNRIKKLRVKIMRQFLNCNNLISLKKFTLFFDLIFFFLFILWCFEEGTVWMKFPKVLKCAQQYKNQVERWESWLIYGSKEYKKVKSIAVYTVSTGAYWSNQTVHSFITKKGKYFCVNFNRYSKKKKKTGKNKTINNKD